MQLPPLSLYIHVPWCRRKCPFCDLESRGLRGTLPAQAYVEALVRDMHYAADAVQGRIVQSIFFGGGTPGLLPVTALGRLLEEVARQFSPEPEVEVSLELHPLDISPARLADYRATGVNRLSIGVQSFTDSMLAAIGRPYSGAYARTVVRQAKQYFERLNLDLMYGLPGQLPAMALSDLHEACALDPEHLSWYPLSLQPGTPFHRVRPAALPGEDALVEMEAEGTACLTASGYERYEICAWAHHGGACRHNLNYWEFGDYLGLGAGAHGKLSQVSDHIVREQRLRQPDRYIAAAGGPEAIVERRELNLADRVLEFMMNVLRLSRGFPLSLFPARTGLPVSLLRQPLDRAVASGLLELSCHRALLTTKGLDFHNDLVSIFDLEPAEIPQLLPHQELISLAPGTQGI